MSALTDIAEKMQAAMLADNNPLIKEYTTAAGQKNVKITPADVATALTISKNIENMADRETNGIISLIERDFS